MWIPSHQRVGGRISKQTSPRRAGGGEKVMVLNSGPEEGGGLYVGAGKRTEAMTMALETATYDFPG